MASTKGIWVLTESYNDYDQHGEYYVQAWVGKPNLDDLLKAGVNPGDIDHVLAGGGRRNNEYNYYNLTEQK